MKIRVSYEINLTDKIKELFTNEYSEIWITSGDGNEYNGKMVESGIDVEDRLGNEYMIKWEVFDEIDMLFEEMGNRVIRGDALRYRLGQSGLGIDSLEGRVAFKVYNRGLGDRVRPKVDVIEGLLVSTGYFEGKEEFIVAIHPYERGIKQKRVQRTEQKRNVVEIKPVKPLNKEKKLHVATKEPKVEAVAVPVKEESGKLVLDTVKKLSKENMINPFAVNFLLDHKHSKDAFSIEESFLKKYNTEKNLYEQRYNTNGSKISYYKDVILINSEEYLLYNEWNEMSKEKFLQWLKKLLRSTKK